MILYRRVLLPTEEPIQFVGVYVLRWHDHPPHPTHGFVEVESLETQAGDVVRMLLETLESIVVMDAYDVTDAKWMQNLAQAAIKAAEEAL